VRVVGQSAKYAAFLTVNTGFTLPPMVVGQKNCLVAGTLMLCFEALWFVAQSQ